MRAAAADTRKVILEAARSRLLADGYAGLSTRKVADEAGVPLSQLHYHFGSKSGLILELLRTENRQRLERQNRMYAQATPLWQRYEQAYDAYLEDFAARSVAGIGFGWVRLDRQPQGHEAAPRRRFEHLGHPAQQPVGAVLAETVRRERELDRLGPSWEQLHLDVPEHVTEERHGRPGAEDPAVILVRQGAGLQRTAVLTSEAAGLMGACDGELSVGQIVAALGALLDWQAEPGHRPQEALALLEQTRSLLVDGFLDVVDPEGPEVPAQS